MTPFEVLVETIAHLRREDLERWLHENLVAAQRESGQLLFAEAECARVRLICTLHYELEVGDEALPVVLSLLDQLYDARARLDALGRAVAAQPDSVRAQIISLLRDEG